MLNQMPFLYITTIITVCFNAFLILQFKFNLYEPRTFGIELFNFQNNEAVLIFCGVFGFIGLILGLHYYNASLPIQEAMAVIIMTLVLMLEVDISKNKMILTSVKSRFDLARTRSKIMTFNFLLPKQKYQIFATLSGAFLSTVILGTARQNYVTSFLLFLGCIMFFLLSIDYIIQYLLLSQSIVYANKVITEIIKAFMATTLFTYITTFIVSRYVLNMESAPIHIEEYTRIFIVFQITYALFYCGLIMFFVYRLYQTFRVNNKRSIKEKKKMVKEIG